MFFVTKKSFDDVEYRVRVLEVTLDTLMANIARRNSANSNANTKKRKYIKSGKYSKKNK